MKYIFDENIKNKNFLYALCPPLHYIQMSPKMTTPFHGLCELRCWQHDVAELCGSVWYVSRRRRLMTEIILLVTKGTEFALLVQFFGRNAAMVGEPNCIIRN